MARNRSFLLFKWVILSLVTTVASSRRFDHGVRLDSQAPLIIAHRGASGILPEHTVEAYKAAIAQGADVIECDVTVTKDLQLICLHHSTLNDATNVNNGSFPQFAGRQTTYNISNEWYDEIQYITHADDWFSVDFTLAELKLLRKKQEINIRDPYFDYMYEIATLEELILLVKNASRPIGLHLETKAPRWVNSLPFMVNTTVEELLVQKLHQYGYTKKTDPCFLQSYEEESLYRLKNLTDLPLVRLIYVPLINTSDARLQEWSQSFYGIGPWKVAIVPAYSLTKGYKVNLVQATDLVERAHRHGLKVHAYTFRNEDKYLAWDFHQDPVKEYEFYTNLGVDGFFTDFPGTMKRYLDSKYKDDGDNEDESKKCGTSTGFLIAPTRLLTIYMVLIFSLML